MAHWVSRRPAELRGILGPLLAFYTTHGVFPAVQSAARAALTGSQSAVETMRRAYQERRDLLLDGLRGQSAIRVPKPQGAFYAFADVSVAQAGRDIWALVDEWLSLGVAVLPGTAFGPEFGSWVRISLRTRGETIAEAPRGSSSTSAPRASASVHGVLPRVRHGVRAGGRRLPSCRGRSFRNARPMADVRGRPSRADAAAGALALRRARAPRHPAVLRSATLPGYGSVRRDWSTTAWGEILVAPKDATRRALIADYLAALERGGAVRDEDVEGRSR
jgi:hypothetical protein